MNLRDSFRGNWSILALVASLGLNLIGIGVLAGALLNGPPPPPPPVQGVPLWQVARALPEPFRHDLGRALRDSRPDWNGAREALRNQRTALAAALTAEPFDQDAVAALLTSQSRLADDLSSQGTGLLMAQIARMSAQDRADFATALRRDRPHGPPGPEDGPPPSPPPD